MDATWMIVTLFSISLVSFQLMTTMTIFSFVDFDFFSVQRNLKIPVQASARHVPHGTNNDRTKFIFIYP